MINYNFKVGDKVDLYFLHNFDSNCIACLFKTDNNPNRCWTWYNNDLANTDLEQEQTSVIKIDDIIYDIKTDLCIFIGHSTTKGEFIDDGSENFKTIEDAIKEIEKEENITFDSQKEAYSENAME